MVAGSYLYVRIDDGILHIDKFTLDVDFVLCFETVEVDSTRSPTRSFKILKVPILTWVAHSLRPRPHCMTNTMQIFNLLHL